MRWNHLSRLAVVLSLASGAAFGQSPAFDLKSALALADADNLELRAARQQKAVALAGITIAGQMPNPTVSFSASRDAPHESLLWDQPLELGGKRGKRIAVAREEQRATGIDIAAVARQVRHRTRDAFYHALLARAQAEQSQAALDLATRIRDAVQQRYEAGDVAQLETIQAGIEVARATAELEAAAQEQKIADSQLAVLLNRALDRPLDLRGRLEDLPQPGTLPALTATALASNTEVQRTSQELAIEERRLGLAKSARIPNVDLQAGVDLNSPGDYHVGPRGQIAVNLPLFNHGQGEVAQSNARLQLFRLALQAQKNNAEAEVFAAYYDYVAKSHLAAQYANTVVPQTSRLEEMAEESYRSGKSNLLTLIDAQRRLTETRKAYLDSLFSVHSTFAVLEEVVGDALD